MPPDMLLSYVCNDNERLRQIAWSVHYVRKGCTPEKAQWVASRKCRKSFTWPPAKP
jgi:hypothetical protein